MKKNLGQMPLVLGPSSWGAGMTASGPVPVPPCPTGSVRAPDGQCRPTTTSQGGVTPQPARRTLPGTHPLRQQG
jgi:hypothetical protein